MTTPRPACSVSRKCSPHRSLCKFYTPSTKRLKLKTPRSKRIVATAVANRIADNDAAAKQSFKDILDRQWNAHSLSPLYNFKCSSEFFKRYARSLDIAFTQAVGSQICLEETEVKCSIDIYPGLNFHPDDHEAVKIQVTQKSQFDGKESVILRAILLCVDMEQSLFPSEISSHFCYFPVIITSGNKLKAEILIEWLEQHFDCRSSPLAFTDSDLRWFLALGCSQMKCDKKMDVLLQYDISKTCSGLNMMSCSFEFEFCQELWNRLNDDSQTKDVITEEEVNRFCTSLENHLEHTMHIYVTKLTLCEVGSPMAYISTKGKFKMFFHQSVFHTLHFICDIAKEQYTQFYQS